MIVYPNCKINLGLRILNKRSDNYHNIETVCLPVGWCDILEILPYNGIYFTSQGLHIQGDWEQNLCVKAVKLLQNDYPEKVKGANIHLHKRIPMGAGLGGGSADAAYTLMAINALYELNMSKVKLEKYAQVLGSDTALFLYNSPQFCYERGEKTQCIHLSLPYPVLVIYPAVHSDTKAAYQNINYQNYEGKSLLKDITEIPIEQWKTHIHNDFEYSVGRTYPQIVELKEKLYHYGAIYASMSGSGSAVYGIFEEAYSIKKVIRELPKHFLYHTQSFIC
jgi:4-diphosphocytidyl-2-C-methyl-D-erythritol kinase